MAAITLGDTRVSTTAQVRACVFAIATLPLVAGRIEVVGPPCFVVFPLLRAVGGGGLEEDFGFPVRGGFSPPVDGRMDGPLFFNGLLLEVTAGGVAIFRLRRRVIFPEETTSEDDHVDDVNKPEVGLNWANLRSEWGKRYTKTLPQAQRTLIN